MRRMLPAPETELLELQALRGRLTVLGGRIIPLFAVPALQVDNFSGHRSLLIPSRANTARRFCNFVIWQFRNLKPGAFDLTLPNYPMTKLPIATSISPQSFPRPPCVHLRGWRSVNPFPSRLA